jgi:succinoglycan biosynthesis transport protein ExoP
LTRVSNGFGGGDPGQRQAEGADLSALGHALQRQLWVVLLAVVVGAVAALGLSLSQEKKYTATAALLQRASTLGLGEINSPLASPESTPERDTATNLALASLGAVRDRTVQRLERGGVADAAQVAEEIEATPKEESDLVEVMATAASPTLAARAANAFAAEFVAFRADLNARNIRKARAIVVRSAKGLRREQSLLDRRVESSVGTSRDRRRLRIVSDRIRSLETRSEDLSILGSLQTGDTAVVERASPPGSPSSPKPARDFMVGAFAGLLLGFALAFLREQFDRRLRRSKDLEEVFGLPVLASIPASKALSGGGTKPEDLPPAEREAFRMLRASLRYHRSDREIRSVMITSPAAEDGKTTVALNLAAAAADVGMSVLLIEADVRRPGLARLFGLPSDVGLTSVLDGRTQIDELRNEVGVTQRSNGSAAPRTMDVVVAGSNPALADEVVESERMRELIGQAEQRYDLVVVDTPPASIIADPISLLNQVSAVIVVGRIDRITGEDMVRLRDQLNRFDAPTLGIVANFTPPQEGRYEMYGYGIQPGQKADV